MAYKRLAAIKKGFPAKSGFRTHTITCTSANGAVFTEAVPSEYFMLSYTLRKIIKLVVALDAHI